MSIKKEEMTKLSKYFYESTTKYEVVALADENVKLPVIEVEQNSLNVTTGLEIALPEYHAYSENGKVDTQISLFYKGELLKTFGEEERLVYTPTRNGVYTVNYIATDYVGNVMQTTVTITAKAQDDPIFQGDVQLPDIFVSGWSYSLPQLFAIDYSGEQPEEIQAMVKAYDSRDGYVIENGKYTPIVESSQEITLLYSVTTKNGYAEREYKVLVQKTQDQNGLKVAEYFVGENVNIATTETAVSITANGTGSKVKFINPLIIGKNGLTFAFNVPMNGNGFDELNVYLTDSINEKNTIKITLYKGNAQNENDNAFTTMKINGETSSYRVPGSFLNGAEFELTYEEVGRLVTASNGAKAAVGKTVDGQKFQGFESRFVYISFEFEKVSSNSCLNVIKLNNQSLKSSVTEDKTTPQIAILGEYGGMASVNKATTVMCAVAGDVLSERATVTMTVEAPSGVGKVQSTNGIVLENVDGTKEYSFIPTKYGVYRIVFTATDESDRSTTTSYNITVVDNDGPQISINGEVPKELILKNGKAILTLPKVTATDESGKEVRIVYNLKRPDGTMVRIEEEEVTVSAVGRYVLYVSAYDASGNQTLQSFVILVR